MASAKPRVVKPPKAKGPRYELWVNDEHRGVYDSEESAEMHVHELQFNLLCVRSVLIKPEEEK